MWGAGGDSGGFLGVRRFLWRAPGELWGAAAGPRSPTPPPFPPGPGRAPAAAAAAPPAVGESREGFGGVWGAPPHARPRGGLRRPAPPPIVPCLFPKINPAAPIPGNFPDVIGGGAFAPATPSSTTPAVGEGRRPRVFAPPERGRGALRPWPRPAPLPLAAAAPATVNQRRAGRAASRVAVHQSARSGGGTWRSIHKVVAVPGNGGGDGILPDRPGNPWRPL